MIDAVSILAGIPLKILYNGQTEGIEQQPLLPRPSVRSWFNKPTFARGDVNG
jgi:hypothetical protein